MRVLGVDGGGTATKAVILDGSTTTWLPDGPPINGIMDRDLADRLGSIIAQTRAEVVGLGIAGLRDPESQRILAETVRRRCGLAPAVTDDAGAALWGAFGAEPGIVVIAGTGSVAVGRGSDGQTFRLGGHGYLVGDEGSGYWIGRELARRALRSVAGIDEHDPQLERVVGSVLGHTVDDIEWNVYGSLSARSVLAAVAREAASVESPTVTAIFAEASAHLVDLARAMRLRAGDLPLATVGGVWRIERVRRPFEAVIRTVPEREPPAIGAARLAMHARPADAER